MTDKPAVLGDARDLLGQIRGEHDAFVSSMRTAAQHAFRCGELLSTARATVGRGFGAWLERHGKQLGFGRATAYRYLGFFQQVGSVSALRQIGEDAYGRFLALPKPRANDFVQGANECPSCTVRDLETLADRGMKFGTIYADPPWPYGNQATRAATRNHYKQHDALTVADIGALPIDRLAAENAQLHLWTTNSFLREAFDIITAWGFEYRSCFVWCKEKLGIGNYWRVSHEFLLLGIRGSATFHERSLKSWGVLPRGRHSEKPERVREMIERAGDGPRLELFGRRAARGWVVWGDEIRRGLFEQNIEEWVA